MHRLFIALGTALAMLGIILGAFGAHGLSPHLDEQAMNWFQTAVQYQFYHAFGLISVGLFSMLTYPSRLISSAGWLMLFGCFIFCGSLYAMSLGAPRWFGAITPIGGTGFIAAWACFTIAALKTPYTRNH